MALREMLKDVKKTLEDKNETEKEAEPTISAASKNPSWRKKRGHRRGLSEGSVIFNSEPLATVDPRKARSPELESHKPRASPTLVLNPLMEDYLEVKLKNKWKRRFIVLDPFNLFLFKSPEDRGTPMQIQLMLATPKAVSDKKTQFVVITRNETFKFEAQSEMNALGWISGIQEVCNSLTLGSIDKHQLENVDTKTELLEISKSFGNNLCADCGEKDPEWASTNLGIFICIKCSGIHRNLGTHISKVRSIKLDGWDLEQVRVMKLIGNVKANKIWEANIPSPFEKISPNSSEKDRQEWIQAKYELGLFKATNQKDNQINGNTSDDWKEAVSPDGRKYYWNVNTKERRWKKPNTDLPENWREALAPDGRKYYYNIKTRERKWKKPTNEGNEGKSLSQSATFNISKEEIEMLDEEERILALEQE